MKRRGPCVHQQNLQASASSSAPTSTAQPLVSKRNIAAAACLRLYAEGQEQIAHKEQLYSKFGLLKVPLKVTMGSTTTNTTDSRNSVKPETSTTTNVTRLATTTGVNQVSRSTVVETRRAAVQLKHGDLSASGSLSKERRSNTVYVPPGGRSPPTPAMGQIFAKTFSLQSTMESRAAVAPRRKPTANVSRKPPSPKGSARRDHGATSVTAKHDRPTSANSASINTAKTRRVSTAYVSLARGGAPLVLNQQNQSGVQLKQMNHRASIVNGSSENTMTRGSRASMVSLSSAAMVGRRPSTAPIQQSPQKTRTYSTIFQQQRQEPVLVQVSRRTSSPIIPPVGPRRPSVAPIGPALSPSRVVDVPSCVSPSASVCSPRASFIRRDNKLEKLQEQVNVLKASLGISDEDLQWKVESAKGNAFLAADKHLLACEERYDRLVFEMQELSQPARCADEDKANVVLAAKLRSLEKQAQQVAELKAKAVAYQADLVQTKKNLLTVRVEAELQRAKQDSSAAASAAETEVSTIKRLENIKEGLLSAQQQLTTEQGALQALLEWLGSETDRFGASVAADDLSPSCVVSEQTLEAKRSLLYTLRTIPECTQGSERLSTLCSQATQLAARITASRAHDLKYTEAELERTMREVEIWKTRREQAKEFADEMRKREAAWQVKQREKNEECLALMRTYIPIDIADLSVEGLIARAQEGTNGPGSGVLYTYDLAAYLKTNRFLHWMVTHEDDITRANFLAIESASFFMDFVNYDIHELRALARVLPGNFAFDKDGRKNAWRTSFIDHVRQLAAQEQHETIMAGWDPVKRARRDVQLPEPTVRQQLNPIFCYPTDAEIDARLDKFERQRARIEAKRVRLKKLDEELIPQAKAEYVAVADDARNENLQRSFGKSTLIALREEAKQQHLALCKERDTAKGELAHGERAWAAMTPSFEQYQAEVTQIRALDQDIRNAPRIRGPFPAELDVQPRERAAFKKLSVEEEAEARKRELDNAIAKRSLDMNEVAVVDEANAGSSGEPTTNGVVVKDSALTEAELEATRLMKLEDKAPTETSMKSDLPTKAAPLSRGFKRVKSLEVAVGVLQFLEKDFCSPKRMLRKEGSFLSPRKKAEALELEETTETSDKSDEPIIRTPQGSITLPSTPKTATKEEDTTMPKPPMVVQPKSKALLKLLEARKAEGGNGPKATSAAPPPSPFGGKINFLGELQNRFQRKTSNAQDAATPNVDEQTTTDAGARKPMNFLDELKSASRKTSTQEASSDGPPKKPMNFLDEPKSASARKTATSNENTETISPQVSANGSTGAPSTPRNFLDELKARARATS